MRAIEAIAVFATSAGTTYGAFKIIEETVRPSARAQLSTWLHSRERQVLSEIAAPTLLRALAASYLHRLNVLTLLLASAFYSIVAAALVVMWIVTAETPGKVCLACPDDWAGLISDPELWKLVAACFALALVPDLFSLVKTRAIVLSDAFTRHPVLMLALDVALSLVIAVGWTIAVVLVCTRLGLSRSATYAFPTLLTAVAPALFTLLFVAYAWLAKILIRTLRTNWVLSKGLLNFEDKPYQSVGLTVAPFVGAACTALAAFLQA